MLLRHHFFLPMLLLVVLVLLSAFVPLAPWIWAVIFVVLSGLLLAFGAFGSLRRFDRLLFQRDFDKVLRSLTPIWQSAKPGRTKHLAGVYLAAAKLGKGDQDGVKEASVILEQIPPDHLAPLARNRYWISQAQISLYQGDPGMALDHLKRCTLHPIHLHLFTQLFLYFSIAFHLTKSEPERCRNFAAKACELNPEDPLCLAQLAFVELANQSEASQKMAQALARWPHPYHVWEHRLYQTSLQNAGR